MMYDISCDATAPCVLLTQRNTLTVSREHQTHHLLLRAVWSTLHTSQVSCLHLQHYRVNEILLTQQNKQTYMYQNTHNIWRSTLKDMSAEPLFGLLTHQDRHRQINTLNTIPVFTITAG